MLYAQKSLRLSTLLRVVPCVNIADEIFVAAININNNYKRNFLLLQS